MPLRGEACRSGRKAFAVVSGLQPHYFFACVGHLVQVDPNRTRYVVSAPIFISYSSKDQKIAETICRALEARGYDCWIAARDVGPGENFQEAIVKALRGARLMLLVFTGNANNSDEIKKEVVLAGRHHVTVVPVRVEDVVPNDALAYEFATRQWIDLFTDWEREIERLVSQIGSILSDAADGGQNREGGAAVAEKPAPAAPVAKKLPLRQLGLLVPVLVLFGLGAGAYFYQHPVGQTPAQPPASPALPQASPVPPSASSAAPSPVSAPPPSAPTPAQSTPPAPPQSTADERTWLDATNTGMVQAFRQYLVDFPDGTHVAEARQRIQAADDHAWTNAAGAGTMVAINQYLAQFPAGAHVEQAKSSIAALEQKAANQKSSAPTRRFDGNWLATISCPDSGPAKGYMVQLAAQVKDGNFHGRHGIDGKPDSLALDGSIQIDGSVELYAQGLTGDPRFTAGKVAQGSPIAYHIQAKFEGSSGSGSRTEQRQCTFTAFKR